MEARYEAGSCFTAQDVNETFVCLFSWRYNPLWLYFSQTVAGFSLLVFEVFLITHNDAPHSVRLLWTSD
jgi:hypothetical protein